MSCLLFMDSNTNNKANNKHMNNYDKIKSHDISIGM